MHLLNDVPIKQIKLAENPIQLPQTAGPSQTDQKLYWQLASSQYPLAYVLTQSAPNEKIV